MSIFSSFNTKEIVFLIYLAIINIVSFAAFGIDKSKSKNDQWRIRESTLIILSLLGGASGSMIGMILFKHKTQKKKFYIGIPLIFLLNKFLEIVIVNYIR